MIWWIPALYHSTSVRCTNIVIINIWQAVAQLPNITWGWQGVRVLHGWDQCSASPMWTWICIFMSIHLLRCMERIDSHNSLSWSHQCVQMQLHQRVRAPQASEERCIWLLRIPSNPAYIHSDSTVIMMMWGYKCQTWNNYV